MSNEEKKRKISNANNLAVIDTARAYESACRKEYYVVHDGRVVDIKEED